MSLSLVWVFLVSVISAPLSSPSRMVLCEEASVSVGPSLSRMRSWRVTVPCLVPTTPQSQEEM